MTHVSGLSFCIFHKELGNGKKVFQISLLLLPDVDLQVVDLDPSELEATFFLSVELSVP